MLAPSRIVATAAPCLALTLLAALPAHAAAPATVSVRVEGAAETKLPPTLITTDLQPVVKDGKPQDSCPGTNALGALELATGGNWSGQWFGGGLDEEGKFKGLGYAVETVLGESHAFGSGAFWDFWYGHREAAEGACEHELQDGEEILLFPCPETGQCPAPLGIEFVGSPTANVGEPLTVRVRKYTSTGASSAVPGATVSGASTTVSTDVNGSATVDFTSAGELLLRVSAPEALRAEAYVCVHAGNDGTCGTAGSGSTASKPTAAAGNLNFAAASAPYKGPFAVVAQIGGLKEHGVYSRRDAPRLLSGRVSAHVPVASVSIALRRSYRNRCLAYSGARERFLPARCGTAPFFAVSSSASFSYLLPAALAPGRYVFDVQAVDTAGNRTTLARGTSRIVFFVR
jgi:hypothetical protein